MDPVTAAEVIAAGAAEAAQAEAAAEVSATDLADVAVKILELYRVRDQLATLALRQGQYSWRQIAVSCGLTLPEVEQLAEAAGVIPVGLNRPKPPPRRWPQTYNSYNSGG